MKSSANLNVPLPMLVVPVHDLLAHGSVGSRAHGDIGPMPMDARAPGALVWPNDNSTWLVIQVAVCRTALKDALCTRVGAQTARFFTLGSAQPPAA